MPCQDGKCSTHHKRNIEVEVRLDPRARCGGGKTDVEFPVDVDIDLKPRVVDIKRCDSEFDKKNCKLHSRFIVKAEFECCPKIACGVGRTALVDVPVEFDIDYGAKCHGEKKPCDSSTSTKKPNPKCKCRKCRAN